MTAVVRWQSALPVRQALVRQRFGSEAGTSAEAKQILEGSPSHYIVVVERLPMFGPPADAERAKQMEEGLKKAAVLNIKGREPLVPEVVQPGRGSAGPMLAFFFPKNQPISLEDKEVEFQVKMGPMTVKRKFKLAEMLFDGKLEL